MFIIASCQLSYDWGRFNLHHTSNLHIHRCAETVQKRADARQKNGCIKWLLGLSNYIQHNGHCTSLIYYLYNCIYQLHNVIITIQLPSVPEMPMEDSEREGEMERWRAEERGLWELTGECVCVPASLLFPLTRHEKCNSYIILCLHSDERTFDAKFHIFLFCSADKISSIRAPRVLCGHRVPL